MGLICDPSSHGKKERKKKSTSFYSSAGRAILARREYNQLKISNKATGKIKKVPSDGNLVTTGVESLVFTFSETYVTWHPLGMMDTIMLIYLIWDEQILLDHISSYMQNSHWSKEPFCLPLKFIIILFIIMKSMGALCTQGSRQPAKSSSKYYKSGERPMMNWQENGITILPLQLVSSNGMGDYQKTHCKNSTPGPTEDWSCVAVSLPLDPGDRFPQPFMKLINLRWKLK